MFGGHCFLVGEKPITKDKKNSCFAIRWFKSLMKEKVCGKEYILYLLRSTITHSPLSCCL